MKELSIEEKAKAYDKAFERAKQWCNAPNVDKIPTFANRVIKEIFPELKESEDERIKKALITFFQRFPYGSIGDAGTNVKEAIAWIEKQGEQKVPVADFKAKDWYVSKVDGKIRNIYHSVDKVEPKFKVSDWITNGDYTWKIVEIKPLDYILQSQDGNIVDDTISHVDEQFHSFTIQDAKDGDVLSDGTIFIFKDLLSDGSVISYCDYDTDSGEGDVFCPLSMNLMCSKITPATKEQRNLLFQKIKENGYEWDAEKKELKKIEQKSIQETKPFEVEHGKYYYCIKDCFCGGRKQASKGDVVQALRGLPIMSLKNASEYFLPVNFIKEIW